MELINARATDSAVYEAILLHTRRIPAGYLPYVRYGAARHTRDSAARTASGEVELGGWYHSYWRVHGNRRTEALLWPSTCVGYRRKQRCEVGGLWRCGGRHSLQGRLTNRTRFQPILIVTVCVCMCVCIHACMHTHIHTYVDP
jgi:hypothetical protein